jgi:bacterioferritin B
MAPSERFADALNAQIGREYAAAHQYTAIATWYDAETYPRLAQFFYAQADEERDHARKMTDYLLETGQSVRLGDVAAPVNDFPDHVEPIRLALEQERGVTVEIGKLVDIARETHDHASEIFLQWFVSEQVEEEDKISSLLQVAERLRESPMLLEDFLARDGAALRAQGDAAGGAA